MSTYAAELEFAIATAAEAGQEIRRLYEANSAQTYTKSDESPVTDADLASDRIIRSRILTTYPNDGILTEEGIDDEVRLGAERVWIVDPIDGTIQFVERTGQFDVLIALVVAGRPVVSVMLQPATGVYLAAVAGGGAQIGDVGSSDRATATLARPNPEPRFATTIWLGAPASSPFLDRFAERLGVDPPRITQTGLIARGHLDPDSPSIRARPDREVVLPYAEPVHGFLGVPIVGDGTMAWEWDYAAADLVINEAGGRFTDWRGVYFTYNKPVPRNPGGLIIANSPAIHEQMLAAIAPEIDSVNASRRE
ncbi:MAG: 3'(2'),5'-bisphosphate nucleotidase CysQ [Chloroflexota bacterium]|nr:3'(2'),5'-bisphosphate nucleotidase CysQ [Chloroflexota bacterium]